MQNNSEKSNLIKKTVAVALWVTVWFIIAFFTNNKLLVPTPLDALKALAGMMGTAGFYKSVAGSLIRIIMGFATGVIIGTAIAVIAYRYEDFKIFIAPVIGLMKTIPVAAFVVILLIWYGPSNLAFIICMLIVLPGIYYNVNEGLTSTDGDLIEMAKVNGMPIKNMVNYIYRPSVEPYFMSALKNALGMCWKAGVAAEVIGMTDWSLGGKLYESKIYFDTAGVFAIAAVIVVLSVICEKVVMKGAKMYFAWEPATSGTKTASGKSIGARGANAVRLSGVCKRYDDNVLYDNFDAEYTSDNINVLEGVSGSGKTTLLRMIAKLTEPDSGSIDFDGRISMVFQEDRLCDTTAARNVALITGDEKSATGALLQVLDEADINKKVSELSGGMKRRVAIVRAVEAESEVLLLDEPFTGMDEATIEKVRIYIDNNRRGRVVVMATHI